MIFPQVYRIKRCRSWSAARGCPTDLMHFFYHCVVWIVLKAIGIAALIDVWFAHIHTGVNRKYPGRRLMEVIRNGSARFTIVNVCLVLQAIDMVALFDVCFYVCFNYMYYRVHHYRVHRADPEQWLVRVIWFGSALFTIGYVCPCVTVNMLVCINWWMLRLRVIQSQPCRSWSVTYRVIRSGYALFHQC